MSDAKQHEVKMIEAPPTSIMGILRRLGPGLIVAGSIVGSGELIATTKTGAEAGFTLLWLIIIGCVIKVFVQVEFGRYSLVIGETTMAGLNEVPGPTVAVSATGRPGGTALRANWIVWYWFVMWLASIGQLGGIVGGVGQALSISVPLTAAGREYNDYVGLHTDLKVKQAELQRLEQRIAAGTAQPGAERDQYQGEIAALQTKIAEADQKLIAQFGQSQLEELTGSRQPDLAAAVQALAERRAIAEGLAPTAENIDAQRTPALEDLQLDPQTADLPSLLTAVGTARFEELGRRPVEPWDARYWAVIIAMLTSVVLVIGRYGFIQFFSTALVATFTLITVVNVAMLQANPSWSVTGAELWEGLRFGLPGGSDGNSSTAIATALATFGIIGVGASELVTYPYWCLEKGYARFTGERDATEAWAERARGWMRVMRWDAWCSMVVYTFATIAFYMLGAAILWRTGLNPEKGEMVRTLSVMYEPVFGSYAPPLFLFGAFAVLYSTYFVANASHARVFSDAMRVLGIFSVFSGDPKRIYRRSVTILSGFFPMLCVVIYVFFPAPAQLVLLSGLMQAIMLPMLAVAGLYFRYARSDGRITPGLVWDLFLWISAIGMLIAGGWALLDKLW